MNFQRLETLKLILTFDRYSVDINKGLVYKNGIPAGHKNNKGYYVVDFSLSGKRYRYKVHEVIAVVGNLNILNLTINHKDKDKSHNYISNLEVMSLSDNIKYSNSGTGNPSSKLTEEQIKEIRQRYVPWQRGLCNQLAKEFNVSSRNIRRVANEY